MNLITLLCFLPLILLSPNEPDNGIDGTVSAVFDGNTLEVVTDKNESYRVVLAGIDCPELSQEYGTEAKSVLEKCVLHQKVVLFIYGKDRFKNYIGVVFLHDQEDVRIRLLTSGLAWTSEKTPDPELESVRAAAAATKKGLWKQNNPTPPWIYRRQRSMQEAKSR